MSEWQPIETAPENGDFLVFCPDERKKIQSAWKISGDVLVVGGRFHFDLKGKPTHWMPLPPPPTETPKHVMPQFKDVLDMVNALSIRKG